MKTKIIIEVETSKLKPYIIDDEDYKEEQEKSWHRAIFEHVEDFIQGDEFEGRVIERMQDDGESVNPKVQEFIDMGALMISVSRENVKEMQAQER